MYSKSSFEQMFSLHGRTSGCPGQTQPVGRVSSEEGMEREEEDNEGDGGAQLRWDGNNDRVGVKLKARVQKRTEEAIEAEKSVSPPRLKKKTNVSTRGNYKVDKNGAPSVVNVM